MRSRHNVLLQTDPDLLEPLEVDSAAQTELSPRIATSTAQPPVPAGCEAGTQVEEDEIPNLALNIVAPEASGLVGEAMEAAVAEAQHALMVEAIRQRQTVLEQERATEQARLEQAEAAVATLRDQVQHKMTERMELEAAVAARIVAEEAEMMRHEAQERKLLQRGQAEQREHKCRQRATAALPVMAKITSSLEDVQQDTEAVGAVALQSQLQEAALVYLEAAAAEDLRGTVGVALLT